MSKSLELQARLDANIRAAQALNARANPETGGFADDLDKQQYLRLTAEISEIRESVSRFKAMEEMEKLAAETEYRTAKNASSTEPMTYERAFDKWLCLGKDQVLDPEAKRMLETRGTSTQITTTNSLGGFLVPVSFSNQLENMMKYYSSMRAYCQIYADTIGGTLNYPTGDDTSVTGNVNTAANQAADRTVSDLTFGNVTLGDWIIDSGIIKVNQALLNDERVGLLQNVLLENLSNRIGRRENTMLTNGTGTNQSYGLTVASTATGITTTGATAITKNELTRLIYSVDRAYRVGPKVGWMMHDSILGYLRTLDFTSSQYTNIFVQGNLITGEPDRLLGYPVFVNNDLPAATGATGLPVTATKHIYFGDFSKYVIRTIQNVSISRNDQLYWAGLNVGFMGYERLDGNLINQNAIKPLLQA